MRGNKHTLLLLSSPTCLYWRRSILDLLYNLYQVYAGENWWSILVAQTKSPIFNQCASVILHSFLHLIIYDIKQAYGFICYIGNFSSQKKVGKFYFLSDFFLLVMVRHISIFNIFISKRFTIRTLLDKVVSFEKINENFAIEVNILRKNMKIFKRTRCSFDIGWRHFRLNSVLVTDLVASVKYCNIFSLYI